MLTYGQKISCPIEIESKIRPKYKVTGLFLLFVGTKILKKVGNPIKKLLFFAKSGLFFIQCS